MRLYFLFAGGVGDAAHEEDAADRVVADHEDEGAFIDGGRF